MGGPCDPGGCNRGIHAGWHSGALERDSRIRIFTSRHDSWLKRNELSGELPDGRAFACRTLFFGASIVTVPREFSDGPHEPAAERGKGRAGEDSGADSLEFAQQNEQPRGLMRKRPPVVLWILAALFLGGLIALILVGLESG